MINYTVTTYNTQLAPGASGPGSVVLDITPNPGYVVSASNFTINEAEQAEIYTEGLPDDIESAAFTDTTQPGAIGNIVKCTLTLASGFTMPSNDLLLNVDIDGSAEEWVEENADESDEVDVYTGFTIRLPEGGVLVSVTDIDDTTSTISEAADSKYNEKTVFVDRPGLKRNESTHVCRFRISTETGYLLPRSAYLIGNTISKNLRSSKDLVYIKRSFNVVNGDGNTTGIIYDVYFKPDDNYSSADNFKVGFVQPVSEISQLADEITNVDFGRSLVNFKGETKTITVYGRQGSYFDLSVTRDSDSADMITPLLNVQIPVVSDRSYLQGSYTTTVDIPAITSGSESYTVLVSPKSPTVLGSNVPALGYTLNQYVNPTLTLSTSTTQAFSLPDDIVIVGEPFKKGYELDYKRDFEQGFDLDITITATAGNQLQKLKNAQFDNVSQIDSDWTNSVPSANGGTNILISSLSTKNLSATEISITGRVFIDTFGGADVTMDLDLDSIIFEKPL